VKDARDVVLAPVVSEKSYALLEDNVYTFLVHPSASKPEIKDAIESIFEVTVTRVNTLNRKGKRIRNRRSLSYGLATGSVPTLSGPSSPSLRATQ